MPQVTILSRERTSRFPEPGRVEEVVEVIFVSDVYGVRSVSLPPESYRSASSEERAVAPRYGMMPVDAQAEAAERKAIEETLKREAVGPPTSFDVP